MNDQANKHTCQRVKKYIQSKLVKLKNRTNYKINLMSCLFFLQGLKRFDARKVVLEALTKKGLFIKKEDNQMVVPVCR